MRYAEVDALKGVAIIGVLFAHLSFEGRFDASTLNAVGVLQGLFGWCVIAFFFASGLLGKPVGRKDALVGFVRKRFVRLIIPCWVFSVSYRLLRCGLFLTGRFSWDSPIPESAADALGFFLLPEGPQFYFLVYLFCVAVLFELLDLTLPRFLAYWITALAMPLSYVLIDGPARGYGPEIALWPVYLFAYAAGRVFAYESVIRKTSHRLVFLFCPLLAAVWGNDEPRCSLCARARPAVDHVSGGRSIGNVGQHNQTGVHIHRSSMFGTRQSFCRS